jgi:uncharacterized protein YbjQ (UPF0145 family)
VSADQDPAVVSDAGLVVTRATAPLRADEAELVTRHWRRALTWHVFLPRAADLDDDDREEVTKFIRAAFRGLTEGQRELAGIWYDTDPCIHALVQARCSRLPSILDQLREASIELDAHVTACRAEWTGACSRLSVDATEGKRIYAAGVRSLELLQAKIRADLNQMQGDALSQLSTELRRAEADVATFVSEAPLGQIQESINDLVGGRIRTVSQSVHTQAEAGLAAVADLASSQLAGAAILTAHTSDAQSGAESTGLRCNVELKLGRATGASELMPGLLRSGLGGVGVGALVAHTILMPLALPVGIAALAVFGSQARRQEERRLRGEIGRAVREYFQANLLRCQSDLRKMLVGRAAELTENLDRACQHALQSLREQYEGGTWRQQLPAIELRLTQSREVQSRLVRLVDRIDGEQGRQEIITHLEHAIE